MKHHQKITAILMICTLLLLTACTGSVTPERLVVLDAGHGGKDVGCSHGETLEKDINLAVALQTKTALEKLGYTVVLTRADDTFISLDERVEIANENRRGMFVSIHVNSTEKSTGATGIETYCDANANPHSAALAQAVQDAAVKKTGAKDRNMRDDSNFQVVRYSKIPACLIEIGFINAKAEREKLVKESYQKKLAEAIAEGVEAFFAEREAAEQGMSD